jgi:pimeloyl-ACP methyl ester carboxylesterase
VSERLQATASSETPVFFRSGTETLFGILTEPTTEAIGIAAIQVPGGAQGPSTGRNQTAARLSRRLAAEGYHAFRFDYHGVGESTGTVERFRLNEPFDQDVAGGIDWLRTVGIERFVLIGGCFGARTALACATRMRGIEALVLRAIPVRDKEKDETGTWAIAPTRTFWQYARRAIRPRVILGMVQGNRRRAYIRLMTATWRARGKGEKLNPNGGLDWVSPSLLSGLEAAVEKRMPILVVSGTGDPGFEDFHRAVSGQLGDLLHRADSLVDVSILDGRVGAAADVALQEPVMDLIASWLRRRCQNGG